MTNLYFNNDDEPDNTKFQLADKMKQILDKENVSSIHIDFKSKEDYYNILNSMREFTENNIKVSGTSRENRCEVVLEEEEDLEDVKNK